MTYEKSSANREIQENEYRVRKSTVYTIVAGVIALVAILITLLWQEYPQNVVATNTANNPNVTTPATTQQTNTTTPANQ